MNSARELASDIRESRKSAMDVLDDFLQTIDAKERDVHAFNLVDRETAIEVAGKIDETVASGRDPGPLAGVPVALKDNLCTRNLATTCSSRILEGWEPPYDATVVQRLRAAGAVIIGKTNLDEFAMGSSTEHSAFGPTRNPHDLTRVPGGSSGGSAAAVAAGFAPLALGSDTGGSIRNPASFCSVVGLKPTYGLVSRYGLISYANSMDQIGPLTKTVKDSAFLLNIISGIDPNDNTTRDEKNQDYLKDIDVGIEGKKIGIVSEMTSSEVLSDEVLNSTNDATKTFESIGANCENIELPMVPYAVAAYYTITSTEAGSNLARYDNIRYGYDFNSEGFEFNSYISQARNKLGPEVKRRMILGAVSYTHLTLPTSDLV